MWNCFNGCNVIQAALAFRYSASIRYLLTDSSLRHLLFNVSVMLVCGVHIVYIHPSEDLLWYTTISSSLRVTINRLVLTLLIAPRACMILSKLL